MVERDSFSKKFAAGVTIFGCSFIAAYVFLPGFFQVSLEEDAQMVLGFVMGTMVTTAINWAIGTSKTSEDKTYLSQEGPNEKK